MKEATGVISNRQIATTMTTSATTMSTTMSTTTMPPKVVGLCVFVFDVDYFKILFVITNWKYYLFLKRNFPGNDIPGQGYGNVASYFDCCNICANNPSCTAFSYSSLDRYCWLKNPSN